VREHVEQRDGLLAGGGELREVAGHGRGDVDEPAVLEQGDGERHHRLRRRHHLEPRRRRHRLGRDPLLGAEPARDPDARLDEDLAAPRDDELSPGEAPRRLLPLECPRDRLGPHRAGG
jgi:hypothetical protein